MLLSSCDISVGVLSQLDDLEEIELNTEYQIGNFSDFEEYFEGFDENHIENFHYRVIRTNRSLVPGPTSVVFLGYFEIIEEFWDYYIEGHSWVNRPPLAIPNIPELDYSFDWMESQSWDETHNPRGIGGVFSVCKANRIIYFSL